MLSTSGILVAALLSVAAASPTLKCKVTPADVGWPSESDWQALNETVHGRLIKSIPPGIVCRHDSASYDNASCALVQNNWESADWHAKNPVSVDYNDGKLSTDSEMSQNTSQAHTRCLLQTPVQYSR